VKVPGKIAIWVFCLMFLAVIILQSGNYSYVQDNSHTNYGPSGTSAFLDLVRQSGYQVNLDSTRNPKLSRVMVIPISKSNNDSFRKFLKTIKGETKIVSFVIPEEDRNPPAAQSVVNDVTSANVGDMQPIRLKSDEWQKPQLEDGERVDLLSANGGSTSIAQVVSKNDIRLIQLLDAACLTNRHLDKSNNASIVMGLVAMAAKSGQEVTYATTFSSADSDDSLLAKLGKPFQAAWSQLMILVLVIFVTLSIRFGLAPERRARQRGGRELVDGLAWMTRRKKNARWALRAVFDRVLAELERRHRISREQIIQRTDLYLDMESAVILKDVEAATMNDITEQEAIRYAKDLKRLV
jgi:hypothetical protein